MKYIERGLPGEFESYKKIYVLGRRGKKIRSQDQPVLHEILPQKDNGKAI